MLPLIILAGGLATRLRPVTETVPKSLIEVHGLPFVLHQLMLFEINGFEEIHFCLGYMGEKVEKIIRESHFNERMRIHYSYDGEVLLGTGGAIKKIADNFNDHFFVAYGDSYPDIDYKEVERFFFLNCKNEFTGLMTIYRNERKWDTSNVIFANNEIKLYSKKNNSRRMQYIDYGVGILSKNNFVNYSEDTTFDLADIYEQLSINNNLLGLEMRQRFYEIGSFSGIDDFSAFIKNKK